MPGAGTEHRTATRDERRVARYLGYIAAFNAGDLRAIADHLTEDLVFDWGDVMPALEGRDAFTEFYAFAWQHFAERLTASDIHTEGEVVSAYISNSISVHRDWPGCPIAPMHAGVPFTVSGRMTYRFRGDRICRIAEDLHSSSTTS